MKLKFITLSALLLLAGVAVVSCKKDVSSSFIAPEAAAKETPVPEGMARMSISVSAPLTKADDIAALAGEQKINSLDVFLFRATGAGMSDNGLLDAYHRATSAEIAAGEISMDVTTGKKHIFVIANAPESLSRSIENEAGLKAAVSEFSDNGLSSFIMAGSPGDETELSAGAAASNKVDVALRRLVARVKVEKITGAFTSPALRQKDFTLTRIFLAYVPKQLKYVNGDVNDVFGTPADASFTQGDESVTVRGYYTFDAPDAGADGLGRAANGLWNPAVVDNGTVAVADEVAALTLKDISGGYIYVDPASGHTALANNQWKEGVYLYAYPNSSAQTTTEGASDYTTKLVVETSLDGITYYYPISLGYTQPNYAYTVNNITITRAGSTDPNVPVTTAQCKIDITVADWSTGNIIGSFNGEGDENDFVI